MRSHKFKIYAHFILRLKYHVLRVELKKRIHFDESYIIWIVSLDAKKAEAVPQFVTAHCVSPTERGKRSRSGLVECLGKSTEMCWTLRYITGITHGRRVPWQEEAMWRTWRPGSWVSRATTRRMCRLHDFCGDNSGFTFVLCRFAHDHDPRAKWLKLTESSHTMEI